MECSMNHQQRDNNTIWIAVVVVLLLFIANFLNMF